jgi:hypothetical protein
MQRVEFGEEAKNEWRAGTALPEGLPVASAVPPEVEDARRRFVLALRSMTARKERQEQDAIAIRGWMKTLEADVAAYRNWKRRKQRRQLFVWGVLAFIFFGHSIPVLRGLGDYWWLLFFGIGGGAAAQAVDSRRSSEMARLLATSRDPRAVSVLAVAARDGDTDTARRAESGLRSILPQLRASDSEHITEEGMNAILALLGRTADPPLQVAILRALEQVGDNRAISLVDMLAASGDTREIREAAESCL